MQVCRVRRRGRRPKPVSIACGVRPRVRVRRRGRRPKPVSIACGVRPRVRVRRRGRRPKRTENGRRRTENGRRRTNLKPYSGGGGQSQSPSQKRDPEPDHRNPKPRCAPNCWCACVGIFTPMRKRDKGDVTDGGCGGLRRVLRTVAAGALEG